MIIAYFLTFANLLTARSLLAAVYVYAGVMTVGLVQPSCRGPPLFGARHG
jgi:hypothetical protein